MAGARPTPESKPESDTVQSSAAATTAGSAIETPDAAQSVASDADKARAEADAAAAEAANPNRGHFVQYLGPRNLVAASEELKKRKPQLGEGTYAEITPTDWKLGGITASRNYVWSLSNNWRIPATHFSQEQLDYLLSSSKRFELVDGEGVRVER